MPHFSPFGPNVSLRCQDTHIYEHKYILKCVCRSNPFDPSVIQKSFFFFGTSSLYTPIGGGVARRDPIHITPRVKLCIHTMY